MSDLTITAASVAAASGASVEHGVAAEAVTAGKVAYKDATTGAYGLADSNSATAGVRVPVGIFLHAAATGQPVAVATKGPVTIGATLTAGTIYTLSETAGGIQPAADLGSGEYTSVLGMATSTTVLNLKIQSSGVAL